MRMMRTFGRAALGFAVATLMSVSPARAVDTVTIGTVGSPSANLWPLFIGIDKGFFTAENIKVDLIYIPASAPAIQQLAAGSLDMSFSTGLVDPIRATEQGAALAIARFEIQAPPYALIAKSSIKNLKDLKGKVISVGGPKDITRLYVDRCWRRTGSRPANMTTSMPARPRPAHRRCLGGAVDAAILCRHPISLRNQGFNDLGLTIEYAPELAFSGTMANKAWAARNPDVLNRVLAAQSKGTEFFYDERNRAESIQLLVRSAARSPMMSRRHTTSSARTIFRSYRQDIARETESTRRRAGQPRRPAGTRQHRAVPAAGRGPIVGLIGANFRCAKSSRRRSPGSISGSITGTTSRRPSAPAD